MSLYSEAQFESDCMEILGELEWVPMQGAALAPGSGERESWKDIVLRGRLSNAVYNLNPGVPENYLEQAIGEVLTPKSQSAIAENERLHKILVEGYRGIEYTDDDGQLRNPTITFLSANPDKNEFIVANQITIRNQDCERRFDLVAYVNGLPLAVLELKDASSSVGVEGAYNQLQTYVKEFGMAFRFANIVVATDGLSARYGTPFTPFNHFAPWNVDDDGAPVVASELAEDGSAITETELLLWGLFNVERFTQIYREFTAFDDTAEGLVMRIAKPHQYFAVTKAVGSTVMAMRGDKRAGVVWHTTGSGKSMEMELYTAKIMRTPEMGSPTVILLNDRTELDQQLFDTFQASTLLPEAPTQICSREELRDELSKRTSGGIYFSTLQKFGLRGEHKDDAGDVVKAEDAHPLLSARQNIVVIVDEAHRSHYGFGANKPDGYAQHLRSALPNATMLAFTGTPLRTWDRDTRRVFGDDIDVYDMNRAVNDGAVVPVYFEQRLITLGKVEGLIDADLDAAADALLDGLDEAESERIQRSAAALEQIYGSDERLDTLAADIVAHWELRRETMREFIGGPGKAMIVVATRSIAARLYERIVALRPDWHDDADDKGIIKAIYSASPSDPEYIKKHMRRPSALAAVRNRAKDGDDSLELVIVQGMMLTGFDAPALHTLYVDRPLKDALLMQTLARVNRTYKGKHDGLLVAYAPIAENLNAALREFTFDAKESGEKVLGQDVEEALALCGGFVGQIDALLSDVDWRALLSEGRTRDALLRVVAHLRDSRTEGNSDAENPNARPLASQFKSLASKMARAWALAASAENADQLAGTVKFYTEAKTWLIKMDAAERVATGLPIGDDIRTALGKLVVDSTESTGVLDVYKEAGIPLPNLQDLSLDLLQEGKSKSQIALTIDALRRSLLQEARAVTGNNETRHRLFSERLAELMNRYTNSQLTSAQVIAELIELSKEIVAESNRGQQFTPPLNNDELAFFDVVSLNESAAELMSDTTLAQIARDLVETLRKDARTDWTVRDDVRAKLRRSIKRLLRKYNYPPDKQQEALAHVIEQMEKFAPRFAEGSER